MKINRQEFMKLVFLSLGGLCVPMGLEKIECFKERKTYPKGPEWLEEWKGADRRPVRESQNAKARELICAAELGGEVEFEYLGGSTPEEIRTISPGMVFECEGYKGLWVSGYCHKRKAERVFAIDRMKLVS